MSKLLNPLIAVVDSGIGGISILNSLIEKFGRGRYIYYADNLNMPYGNKTKNFIIKRVDEIISYLNTEIKADLIVLACNTASSIIDTSKYKNVIVMTFDENKTYLATKLTKSNICANVIADAHLASNIEKYIFDDKKINKIILDTVKKYKLYDIKEYYLGCTHYELVNKYFSKFCPASIVINNSYSIMPKIDNVQYDFDSLDVKVITSLENNEYLKKIYKLIIKSII